jgi:hypothetical protein
VLEPEQRGLEIGRARLKPPPGEQINFTVKMRTRGSLIKEEQHNIGFFFSHNIKGLL